MKKNGLLFFCVILMSHHFASSQTIYKYYFDKNFNISDKSQSFYNGTGETVSDRFELKLYYNQNQKLAVLQHFTDSTLTMSNGLYVACYPNSLKQIEGYYDMGKEEGLWIKWDSTGRIFDSSFYKNGKIVQSFSFKYYPDGTLSYLIATDPDGKATFFDRKDSIIDDPDIIWTKTVVPATFPGGVSALERYIKIVIQNHISVLNENDYGTVLVKFIVDKDGKISEAHALTMQGTRIAKVAIDAIMKGPNWIPAQQNGRYVKSYRIQPFAFSDPNH